MLSESYGRGYQTVMGAGYNPLISRKGQSIFSNLFTEPGANQRLCGPILGTKCRSYDAKLCFKSSHMNTFNVALKGKKMVYLQGEEEGMGINTFKNYPIVSDPYIALEVCM